MTSENNKAVEEGKMQKCLELLGKGYNRQQLLNDFDFSQPTVDRAIAKFKKEGGTVVLASNQQPSERREIMKIGGRDIIPPEAVLDVIHLPADGQDVQVWRSGVLDGVGLLLLGARYSQLTSSAQAEMLANQIKIMEESRKGSAEMAQEAAARAAAGVGAQIMPEVEALKAQIMSQGQNPMASLMMSMMAPSFQQAGQQLAGLFGATQPGQPQTGGGQQPQQQAVSNPPSIDEHSIEEWEG